MKLSSSHAILSFGLMLQNLFKDFYLSMELATKYHCCKLLLAIFIRTIYLLLISGIWICIVWSKVSAPFMLDRSANNLINVPTYISCVIMKVKQNWIWCLSASMYTSLFKICLFVHILLSFDFLNLPTMRRLSEIFKYLLQKYYAVIM